MKDQSQKAPGPINPASRSANALNFGSPGAGTNATANPDPAKPATIGSTTQPTPTGSNVINGINNPMLASYLGSSGPVQTAAPSPTDGFGPFPSSGTPAPSHTGSSALYPASQAPNYAPVQAASSSPSAPATNGNQFGAVQSSVDMSHVPGLVGGDALRGMTNDARDAAYKQAAGYLDPQWGNDQKALETKLINQGVPQNSEAWNKAMDDFGRQKEFAYSQARNASMNQGLAAEGQLFGQGLSANQNAYGQSLSGAQLANSAQGQVATQGLTQQQIQAQLQAALASSNASTSNVAAQLAAQREQNQFANSLSMRNQGINELLLQQQNPLSIYSQLTQGTGAQQPQFTSTPGTNTAPTDLASIINQAYQGQLTGYNAQTGNANSNNAAMAAIIATIIGGYGSK